MVKKIQGIAAREQFYAQLANRSLSLAETVKMMRAIVGMTQPEYAKFVGIAPIGNPTLETLKKIGKPFWLKIIFSAD